VERSRAEIRQTHAALVAKQAQSGRAARELHHEVTEMFLRPECGSEECDHEDGCPDDNPVQVCAGCWEQLEAADAYIFERPAACEQVRWPCATIRALDGAS